MKGEKVSSENDPRSVLDRNAASDVLEVTKRKYFDMK